MKFFPLLFFLASVTSFAQPEFRVKEDLPEEIVLAVDSFIQREMEKQQIPGLALAVVRDGDPVLVKCYGQANVEHQVPVTPETIFQSGSIGKAFAVMAVLMLAEEGKIDLEAPLKNYMSDAPDAWDGIRIRHLLEHTSGMMDHADLDLQIDHTEQEFFEAYKRMSLAFAPGEQLQYSNAGFSILGMLIGKVTGKPYWEFYEERIFDPLQMTTARIISESDIVPNRAAGYRLVNGELKNQEWVAPSHNLDAAGSLYLSLLDMVKWEAALNKGLLLSKDSYAKMWTPVITRDGIDQPWGMSWYILNENGHTLIGHSGGWQGYVSNIARYPEKKLTVILFANLRGVDPFRLSHVVHGIMSPELGDAGTGR